MNVQILTVGHSTRSLGELIELLRHYRVRTLVDIRRFPGSRRHPHFNRETLAAALPEAGICYVHEPRLGGRRTSSLQVSPNAAWRNPGFRAYADYMQTDEFERGLEATLALAPASSELALMCAEAMPYRCHRSLVADALVARGLSVKHIESLARATAHRLTPFARIDGRRVTYPPEQASLKL